MLYPKPAIANATARITRERISQPLLSQAPNLIDTVALARGGSMAAQLPKNGSDAVAHFFPLRSLAG
jgi:hypothetical protein